MNIKVGDRVRVRVGVGVGVATVVNVAEDLVDFRMQRSGKVVRRHKRNVVEVLGQDDPGESGAVASVSPEPEPPEVGKCDEPAESGCCDDSANPEHEPATACA